MNSGEFAKALEQLPKNGGLKTLVVIVNRADGDKVLGYLREQHFPFLFSCMAEGTQGSEIMSMLGFGTVDKTVVLCMGRGVRIDAVLPAVSEELTLKKAGKGIAFTFPIFGISLPEKPSPINGAVGQWLNTLENEGDEMNHEINHSIVMAVVEQGHSEELVKETKAVGARGGTVINARRAGADDAVKFFGLTVQPEKEIVMILTRRDNKQAIMDAINHSFGPDSPAHGMVLSIPVDGIAGVEL